MKVLYVTTVSSTINAFLVPHIEQLVADGHQVDVACATNQPLNPRLAELGCQFWPISFDRNTLSTQHVQAYRQIRRLMLDQQYDVVHTHTPIASFIVRLAGRQLPHRVVYTAHGFHFHQSASRKNWLLFYPLERLAARWTDLLITINEEDHQNAQKLPLRGYAEYTHGIGFKENVGNISAHFNRQQFRQKYGISPNDQVLVYAAELSDRKQQTRLLSVLPQLADNVKLLLLGDGPLRQKYETLAQQLGVGDRVIFAGYQSTIAPFLAIADIAVSSSKQEGLPVNIMEALATDLPVIATDIRGHRDLISPGVNGFLFETDDQLITQIKLVMQNPHMFDEERVQQLLSPFSLNRVKGEVRQLYRHLEIPDNVNH